VHQESAAHDRQEQQVSSTNSRILGIDANGEYLRGSELPGYEIKGFSEPGLNGVYIRNPQRQLNGRLDNGTIWPTSTYWNSHAPSEKPIFMYWQYYNDHHSICPQYPGDGQDYWFLVSSCTHLKEDGPGIAFYRHQHKQWFEHNGQEFVLRNISFRILQEDELLALASFSAPALPLQQRSLPVARTPPPSVAGMRTPGLRTPILGLRTPTVSGLRTPSSATLPVAVKQEVFREVVKTEVVKTEPPENVGGALASVAVEDDASADETELDKLIQAG